MSDRSQYRTVVEWSSEDNAFVARVPALNAMGHGDTAEEAVREASIGADGILAVMHDEGRPLPPPDVAEEAEKIINS